MPIHPLKAITFLLALGVGRTEAQCLTYKLDDKGDTLNCVDQHHKKQGRWVIHQDELRGEPAYDEQGIFEDDAKEGVWKRFDGMGDLIAVENYKWGSKDGVQEYFTMAGEPLREESWLSANPKNPYDTVTVYDDPHNPFKANRRVVKLDASTVKNGTWKYYDPSLGTVAKTENYVLGKLQNGGLTAMRPTTDSAGAKPPPEVEQYNKKNSGKKKYDIRTGQTGY